MATKKNKKKILVRLASPETGFFKVTSRKSTDNKIQFRKYDPVLRKHVLFVEKKIK